ncbi:hypothetical protein [Legionella tunisiensis]|uniref:hypothetical protein n=1 Tax=Legionella tunisiensis TaxID=1034944 RepID=UPI00031013BC|nr:hypothetical protein [Legionella tunisiensis]
MSKAEVEDITKKFEIYYSEYKNSSTEAIYERETRLTAEEQLAYDEAVEEERSSREVMDSLVNSLLIATVLSGRHPFHRVPAPTSVNLPPKEESEESVDCAIM